VFDNRFSNDEHNVLHTFALVFGDAAVVIPDGRRMWTYATRAAILNA